MIQRGITPIIEKGTWSLESRRGLSAGSLGSEEPCEDKVGSGIKEDDDRARQMFTGRDGSLWVVRPSQ